MNIVKIMSFVLLMFFMGVNAQDQDLLKAAPELIQAQAEHADLYHYDKKEVFAPAHGKVIEWSVSDVTVNHWFTTGSTRTKITIEPYQDDQIKTTTETWTTKNHSYATYSTAGAGIAALVATWLGLKELYVYNLESYIKSRYNDEITFLNNSYNQSEYGISSGENYIDQTRFDGKRTLVSEGSELTYYGTKENGFFISEKLYTRLFARKEDGKSPESVAISDQNYDNLYKITQEDINKLTYEEYRTRYLAWKNK